MLQVAIPCENIDCSGLFDAWVWRIPSTHTPLMIGHFGDAVFCAPDGSHWLLSILDGEYQRIARSSAEFNLLNNDPQSMDDWFCWGWATIAFENGIVPKDGECLGWKIAPILGGQIGVKEIMVFSRRVYLSIQGQLLRQVHQS
jgi:hypothetical protein